MNRIDKAVIVIVAFFVGLACLRAALDVVSSLMGVVVLLSVVYGGVRLGQAGLLPFLKFGKKGPAPDPAERK